MSSNGWEIVKLIAGLLTPATLAIFGIFVTRVTKRFEHAQWKSQKLIEKRLAIYDQLAPEFNDLLCYFTYVGHWRDLTPLQVIELKRSVDKKVYLAAPLFSEEFYFACRNLMKLCFETNAGFGRAALLRTDVGLRKVAQADAWEDEWNDMFSNEPTEPEVIGLAYQRVMRAFAVDIGVQEVFSVPATETIKLGGVAAVTRRSAQEGSNSSSEAVLVKESPDEARPGVDVERAMFLAATDASEAAADCWIVPIRKAMDRFQINTPARQAAFLARLSYTSGAFPLPPLAEKFSYSVAMLNVIFPKLTPEECAALGRQPGEKSVSADRQKELANLVYANIGENGPASSGDGWNYRGSGFLNLSCKTKFDEAGRALGLNLVENPDLVRNDPKIAALVAAWTWQSEGGNEAADTGKSVTAFRRLNPSHLDKEIDDAYNRARNAFGLSSESRA